MASQLAQHTSKTGASMNPALITAGIGAASSLLGGASKAKQERLAREAEDRARKEEILQRQAEMRASVAQDTAGAAERATAGQYERQVADDERNYGRANSNALLPMRQDIMNSLYARLGTYPMQGRGQATPPPDGTPTPPPASAAPTPGPGRQIDFSQQEEFVPQADRSVYDAAVNRVVGQAENPGEVYKPNAPMTQNDRVATSDAMRLKAMDEAEAKFRAENGDKLAKMPRQIQEKLMKEVRHRANVQATAAFYEQHGR